MNKVITVVTQNASVVVAAIIDAHPLASGKRALQRRNLEHL